MRKKHRISTSITKLFLSAAFISTVTLAPAMANSDLYTINSDYSLYSKDGDSSMYVTPSLSMKSITKNYGSGANRTYYYISNSNKWASSPTSSVVYTIGYKDENKPYDISTNTDKIQTGASGSNAMDLKGRVKISSNITVKELDVAFLSGSSDIEQADTLGYSMVYVGNNATLTTLKGSFIDNYVNVSRDATGSVVQVSSARIGTMTADYLSNEINSTGTTLYGAVVGVSNASTVSAITNSNFMSNIITSTGSVYGGALGNRGTITAISNTGFLYNSVNSAKDIQGGALYVNNSATIGSITNSDFMGNEIISTGGNAHGGAIYNIGSIGEIVDTSFYNNTAVANGSNTARGGAIYTTSNLGIRAENKDVVFSGNMVTNGSQTTSEAIYVGNHLANLTLTANNGKSIVFEDNINGVSGYQVTVGGNSTIAFWGDITNARFNVAEDSALKLDFVNYAGNTYSFTQMTSQANTKYYLDADFANKVYDRFVVQSGDGVIHISGLNVFTDMPARTVTLQIIQASAAANMRLEIDQAILDKYSTSGSNQVREEFTSAIGDTIYWSEQLGSRRVVFNYSTSMFLSKTGNNFDSITYQYTENIISEETTLSDALMLYNQYDSEDVPIKNFVATEAGSRYEVSSDLGTTKGILNVSGILDGSDEITSVIDANNYSMFEVGSGARLTVENLVVTGLKNADGSFITNNGGNVTLKNITVGEVQTSAGAKAVILNNSNDFYIGGGTVTLNRSVSGTGSISVNDGAELIVGNYANISQNAINVAGEISTSQFAILNSNVNVESTGKMYIGTADVIKQDINNDGTIQIKSGTLNSAISGSGVLNVWGGTSTFNKQISQSRINIGGDTAYSTIVYTKQEFLRDSVSGVATPVVVTHPGTLYLSTDEEHYTSDITINSTGRLRLSGANLKTIDTEVKGAGWFSLDGNTNIVNNAIIRLCMDISSGSSLTTDVSKLTWNSSGTFHIVNGVLNLSGGTESVPAVMNSGINGSGTTNILEGSNVRIQYGVSTTLNVEENATLSVLASNIKNVFNNAGTINLGVGTLTNTISGTGILNIVDNVVSNVKITQSALNIATGASYRTNANNLVLSSRNTPINIDGTLIFTGGKMYNPLQGTGKLELYNDSTIELFGDIWVPVTVTKGTAVIHDGSHIHKNISSNSLQVRGGIIKDVTISSVLTLVGDVTLENFTYTGYFRISANSNVYMNLNNASVNQIHGGSPNQNRNLWVSGTGNLMIGHSVEGYGAEIHILGDITINRNQSHSITIEEGGILHSDIKYWDPMINGWAPTVTNNGSFYLTGDVKKTIYGTGTTYINKTLTISDTGRIEGTLNMNSGTLNLGNLVITESNINKITGNGNITLDLDATTRTADKLIITDKTSDAKLTITNINLTLSSVNDLVSGIVFQIITGGSNAQLILPQSVIDAAKTSLPIAIRTEDTIAKAYRDDGTSFSFIDASGNVNVNFTDAAKYGIRVKNGTGTATLALATTQKTNDSLSLSITNTNWTTDNFTKTDLFEDFLRYETTHTKTFRFNSANDSITPSKSYYDINISSPTNIIGVYDETTGKRSTIVGNTMAVCFKTLQGGSLVLKDIFTYNWGMAYSQSFFSIAAGTTLTLDNVHFQSMPYGMNYGTIESLSGIFSPRFGAQMISNNGLIKHMSGVFTSVQCTSTQGPTTGIASSSGRWYGSSSSSVLGTIEGDGMIGTNVFRYYQSGGGNVSGYFSGTTYNVKESNFVQNYFNYASPNASYGFFHNAGNVYNFENNLFYGNYTSSWGENRYKAGIALSNTGSMYNGIIGTVFKANYTKSFGSLGAAIYNTGYIGRAQSVMASSGKSIDSSIFDSNYIIHLPYDESRYSRGAAIYNTGTITWGITSSNFTNNYINSEASTYDNANLDIQGGAIYNAGTLPTISNSHFYGNYANSIEGKSFGGAIYTTKPLTITGSSKPTLDSVTTISGKPSDINTNTNSYTSFIDNYVLSGGRTNIISGGGAIYSGSTLNISNTIFTGNYANIASGEGYGGAVMIVSGSNLSISDTIFTANELRSNSYNLGGAIGAKQSKISNISNTVFAANIVGTYADTISSIIDIQRTISTSSVTDHYEPANTKVLKDFYTDIDYTTYTISGTTINNKLITHNISTLNEIISNIQAIPTSSFKGTGFGGAIGLWGGTVDKIANTSFLSNISASCAGTVYGGAISGYWGSKVSRIENSIFEGNTVIARSNSGQGGAIATDAILTLITGELAASAASKFNANSVVSPYGKSIGGAIFTSSGIGKIINTDFTNNYTIGKYSAPIHTRDGDNSVSEIYTPTSLGGAIYTTKNLLFLYGTDKDGNVVNQTQNSHYQISGNFTATLNAAGTEIDTNSLTRQAIWVASSSAKIAFGVTGSAPSGTPLSASTKTTTLTIDDTINGEKGFTTILSNSVNATSRINSATAPTFSKNISELYPTGIIELTSNAKILNSNVEISNVNIDILDNKFTTYEFLTLKSDGSARYALDINFETLESDKFQTIETGSTGIIVIKELNVLGSLSGLGTRTVKVLDINNAGVELALDPKLSITTASGTTLKVVDNVIDSLSNSVKSDQVFVQQAGIAISSTDNPADSISFFSAQEYDTLAIITQKFATGKLFTFNGAHLRNGYTVKTNQNLALGSGDLTIDGKGSTLNLNSNSFILARTSNILNFKDITINNGTIDVQHRLAKISLNNVHLNSNITASTLVNNERFDLALSGSSYINAEIHNANITMNGDDDILYLVKSNALYSSNNADNRLNVQAGFVDLVSSHATPTDYQLNYLYSSSAAKYSLNYNVVNELADSLSIHDSRSSGRVKITSVNYISPAMSSPEILSYINSHLLEGATSYSKVVQVLKGDTQNIQLILADPNASERGQFVIDLDRKEGYFNDTIYFYVRHTDVFNRNYSVITVYGSLELDSSYNANDSIKFVLKRDTASDEARRSSLGDSFFYVLNDNSDDRYRATTFQFNKPTDNYRIDNNKFDSNVIVPLNMIMA